MSWLKQHQKPGMHPVSNCYWFSSHKSRCRQHMVQKVSIVQSQKESLISMSAKFLNLRLFIGLSIHNANMKASGESLFSFGAFLIQKKYYPNSIAKDPIFIKT